MATVRTLALDGSPINGRAPAHSKLSEVNTVERYQDALWADRVESGERDCASRWEVIAPHLPRAGMILDVGSNLGYFGIRAVQANPEIAVVSLEPMRSIALRQQAILRQHDTTRICLVKGGVNRRVAAHWVKTCDWFELTLLLSVVHWFDDPAAVVRALSDMSGAVIADVPDHRDRGACGQSRIRLWGEDPVSWFSDVTGRRVSHLGRIERHTSEHPSHMILVHGPVSRSPSVAYWDRVYPHRLGSDYRIEYDGSRLQLKVRGQIADYEPGINLVSLTKLGQLLYPAGSYWLGEGRRALEGWPGGHRDPFPHNMLWTPSGIRLIDHDDQDTMTTYDQAVTVMGRTITGWSRNRTSLREGYARALLGPSRYSRRVVGRILRRVTSDDAVERLKVRLGL